MDSSSRLDAAWHYRDFCDLNATITGDRAEALQRRELVGEGVSLSRVRALYPLDLDRVYGALAEKLRDQAAVELFLRSAMLAYNPLAFDPLLYVSYDGASEWSQALAEEVAGKLDDFSDEFTAREVPEGWVYTNPPFFHCYDIALGLYTALCVAENWEAWAIDFEIERQQRKEGAQAETWTAVHQPTLDEASVILDLYIRAMKPVLALLS